MLFEEATHVYESFTRQTNLGGNSLRSSSAMFDRVRSRAPRRLHTCVCNSNTSYNNNNNGDLYCALYIISYIRMNVHT